MDSSLISSPSFSPNALKILSSRYLAWIDGKQETVEQFVERVSLGNDEYRKELIEPLYFLPNSPTLFNVGVPGGGTLSACFKFDVADTMGDENKSGIMDVATKAAMVTKWGGGVGYYLGEIRPKNSLVNSTHGKAMGPVALLKFYHAMSSMLTQSGKRDAAQMGILPSSHPDIFEFISCKDDDPQGLSTFNISVSLTDEFMQKATKVGTPENLVLYKMAQSAWRTGDPGVYFVSRAEQDNPTPWLGALTGTNPCGEVPLLNNEPCNLGSINLGRFYTKGTTTSGTGNIDYDSLERVTRLATRYLDDVLDRNHFPVEAVTAAAFRTRKLGLGVCGWADLLALLNINYASQEAVDLLGTTLNKMRTWADDESELLGVSKGNAPCFDGTAIRRRNATTLCIAPTGTIAILMGASSGIEPHYLLQWTRTTGDGIVLSESVPVLDQLNGFVPQTAMEIPWGWHVKMQAAAQKYVDLAVSKTINMPNSATVDDIYSAYVMMWKEGAKGGTVYRDGCRDTQVLNAIKAESETNSLEPAAAKEDSGAQGQKEQEGAGATELCPECSAPAVRTEQCRSCVSCGWSYCSI